MNGGYFMIDCTGLDLIKGSTEQTINGLYEECQKALKANKPVYAVNCVWSTNGLVTPINCMLIQFDGYVIATASTLQIVVTSADKVTINNLVG